MEIVGALLSEKWLLGAAALLWGFSERMERMADKRQMAEERKENREIMDKIAAGLLVIEERLKKD